MARAQQNRSDEQDAIELLMQDHREVEKLIEKFQKIKNADSRKKEEIVRSACSELKIHAQIEEEIFYPAVRKALSEQDVVDEAEVEHATAKQLIGELERMTADDELFDAKFTVLAEYIKHHVQEEESEMIPQAKRAKVDMRALGAEMQKRKQELKKSL